MKRTLKYLVALAAILMLSTGCFISTGPGPDCVADADCPTDTFCEQGACVTPGQIACDFDSDCPPTTLCDALDGFCYFP